MSNSIILSNLFEDIKIEINEELKQILESNIDNLKEKMSVYISECVAEKFNDLFVRADDLDTIDQLGTDISTEVINLFNCEFLLDTSKIKLINYNTNKKISKYFDNKKCFIVRNYTEGVEYIYYVFDNGVIIKKICYVYDNQYCDYLYLEHNISINMLYIIKKLYQDHKTGIDYEKIFLTLNNVNEKIFSLKVSEFDKICKVEYKNIDRIRLELKNKIEILEELISAERIKLEHYENLEKNLSM